VGCNNEVSLAHSGGFPYDFCQHVRINRAKATPANGLPEGVPGTVAKRHMLVFGFFGLGESTVPQYVFQ